MSLHLNLGFSHQRAYETVLSGLSDACTAYRVHIFLHYIGICIEFSNNKAISFIMMIMLIQFLDDFRRSEQYFSFRTDQNDYPKPKIRNGCV